jgi:hypothetical protein
MSKTIANRGPRLTPEGLRPRQPKGRKEGEQRRATREEGGNERGRKQLCTRPVARIAYP